jgi:hypothetical protein
VDQMKQSIFIAVLFLGAASIRAAQVAGGVDAAGYSAPTPIKVAPGQVMTFFVHGIGSAVKQPVRAATLPLPTSLQGISAEWVQYDPAQPVSILGLEPMATCSDITLPGCSPYTAVTVEIPFEIQAVNPTTVQGAPVGGAQLRFFRKRSCCRER